MAAAPKRGMGRGGGKDDPFEREKTFFLPINPNYRLSRRSRRPREEVRELACHREKTEFSTNGRILETMGARL